MASKLAFTLTSPRRSFSSLIKRPFNPLSSSSSFSPSSTRVQSFHFNGIPLCLRRRLCVLVPTKVTADQEGKVEEGEVVDSKILPYCSVDKKEKKSLGELELEFLQALQAFYHEGKAIMSNKEFDNLKEELMWEVSSVVMLTNAGADEQRFLEASMAYVSGNPIMSEEEFDKLKTKTKGSEIVVEGPSCSLRSRKVYSDLSVDYLKMFLLNVPATIVALALFFFLDDTTGVEISYLLELPGPFSFIFTWFAAVPLIVWPSQTFTKAIVKDFLTLEGPCPNCGTENTSFFGTIFPVTVPPAKFNAQTVQLKRYMTQIPA